LIAYTPSLCNEIISIASLEIKMHIEKKEKKIPKTPSERSEIATTRASPIGEIPRLQKGISKPMTPKR
jgi:hypothetical protein